MRTEPKHTESKPDEENDGKKKYTGWNPNDIPKKITEKMSAIDINEKLQGYNNGHVVYSLNSAQKVDILNKMINDHVFDDTETELEAVTICQLYKDFTALSFNDFENAIPLAQRFEEKGLIDEALDLYNRAIRESYNHTTVGMTAHQIAGFWHNKVADSEEHVKSEKEKREDRHESIKKIAEDAVSRINSQLKSK